MTLVFPAATLLLISIVTNLTVESVKKLLNRNDAAYSSNILAVSVSVIVAIVICSVYLVMNDIAFSTKIGVEMFVMTYLSFLTATVGYDKVMQTIEQIKTTK